MKRRQFIAGLVGATAASPVILPLAARALQRGGVRRVGVLMDGIADAESWRKIP